MVIGVGEAVETGVVVEGQEVDVVITVETIADAVVPGVGAAAQVEDNSSKAAPRSTGPRSSVFTARNTDTRRRIVRSGGLLRPRGRPKREELSRSGS